MAPPSSQKPLIIKNARENNLKEISTELPHDSFTVITGLSGSGKSSLAFDTVYAEGQRRYIETFSPYTRQFFDKVKKPDVDYVENVRPAIAIQQRTRITNSRSTVGTMTNINDYLKLLWPAIATPVCTTCGITFEQWDAPRLAEHIIKLHRIKGYPALLLAAPLRLPTSKKDRAKELERLTVLGFTRYFNPTTLATESWEDSALPTHSLQALSEDSILYLVLDRFRGESPQQKRVKESIEQAFTLTATQKGGGSCVLIQPNEERAAPQRSYLRILNTEIQQNISAPSYEIYSFQDTIGCPHSGEKIEKPSPALFSFNHPVGACSACKGFGRILRIDPALIVPNPQLSLKAHAIQCWSSEGTKREHKELLAFCASKKIPTDVPWSALTAAHKDLLFNEKNKDFWGLTHWFGWLEKKAYKMHVRVYLSKYRSPFVCSSCHGTRLTPSALAYRVEGHTLPALWNMPIHELLKWLTDIERTRADSRRLPRELKELFTAVTSRLRYLDALGLSYLTLERQARTLSGGETQRVNLAAALGSELIATHFVLDEPSVGLHPRDTARLISCLHTLHERGNSLLVVEHDLDCINEADHIVEMGPLAGERGGEITYSGPSKSWGGIQVTPKLSDSFIPQGNALKITNATERNLKGFSTNIPLNAVVCLTGVSGSGKSTLIHEVIYKAYEEYVKKTPITRDENIVTGFEHISQVLLIDQSPLAKSPRGNIGTYSGIWEHIRELLSSTDDAIARALSKSAFSFNVDGGRCPECKGAGFIKEDMQFLSDVYIPCEVCLGKRFQESVLAVQYKGKNAHELLATSAEECTQLFADISEIAQPAQTLCELGLGHLTLGHPLSELSGGEAQRLKLVPFIQKSAEGSSLLIFDEPTTGLHHYDVEKFIQLLFTLTAHGHSILCIEHNIAVMSAADWIIDIGPESGIYGGELIRQGTPADIAKKIETKHYSHTAEHLSRYAYDTPVTPRTATKNNRATDESARLQRVGEEKKLTIKGAKENNLKNIDIEIPLGEFVAITGVSGSGKSSLAKDIIYAEGQRRYLDCLSPYARQYIKELKKPDIEEIHNIAPTICVYQHTFQPSKLSTIGTMSEVYNFLRLLYAKTGIQHCPDHPEEAISPLSPEEMTHQIKSLSAKTIRILAPVIKKKKGNHRAILERAVQSEIAQVRVDGVFLSPSSVSMNGGLEKGKAHTIEFVIAKCNPKTIPFDLLLESVRQSLSLASGTLVVVADNHELILSTERTCSQCKRGFFKPDPEDLSFSSRRGACSVCSGSGVDKKGATCSECEGSRLNPLGRNIRIQQKNIFDAAHQTPLQLSEFLESTPFDERARAIATPVLTELYARIRALDEVGLGYLPLTRACATLSGGELQRLRLATAMGSPLTGIIYIFDEPSAGLHPDDNEKVLTRLRTLCERGNSVLMIEHDAHSISAAKHIVDIGPGGGKRGGEVVYNGPREGFASCTTSETARALYASAERTNDQATEPFIPKEFLSIRKAQCNNIRGLNVKIPLGGLITIAGVSGAGKSSLVRGCIAQALTDNPDGKTSWKSGETTLSSSVEIARVLEVDQKPIGSTSRSTPASYLGIWDDIRALFAQTLEAKSRGWKHSFFSFNSGKGRCSECKGQGQIKLEMSFLPDAYIQCERCRGTRFTEEARSVRYLGLSITEVLQLTFEEAMSTFVNHRKIYQPLRQACDLGLGYLTLGQNSATLSGGESQRIKLVSELSATRKGHTLYILDEPTTGLHMTDVARLIKTLKTLVSLGHTVITIEHDADMIRHSDYILELGPGPGDEGGKLLFAGAPQLLSRERTPWGKILRS